MAIKKRSLSAIGAVEPGVQVALFADGKKIATMPYSKFLKEYRRLKDLAGITFTSIEGGSSHGNV